MDCNESLNLQPDYAKCLERRATLLESKDRLSDALEDYKKILQLDPSNQKARHACAVSLLLILTVSFYCFVLLMLLFLIFLREFNFFIAFVSNLEIVC